MPKILLVEDNEMNRDLISRRLKRRGFEVELAHDGAEGVEKASSQHPDLILMDMGLPVIDGYEATRILKNNADTRGIPVIGLSAHAMSGDADRALEAGCDDYDTKPVEWPRLLGKIQAQLDRASETTILATSEFQSIPGVEQGSGPVPHFLLVDDNAVHRDVLSGHLGTLGYTHEVAQSSHEALELLRGKTFDGVLLDVTLPPVEDRPLIEHLRSEGPWQHLAVLMLCPIDAVAEATAALAQGADDILAQPFALPLLKARIENSLGSRRGSESAADSEALVESRRRSRYLLGSLIPEPMVRELEERRRLPPRVAADAVVLVSDVLGFARLCDGGDPVATVAMLHRLVSAFEAIADRHGLEKVRTSGETFVAAAGLFDRRPGTELSAVLCALEMREEARRIAQGWSVRFGLHRGSVTLGVIGQRRYQFDLWGGAIELAELVRNHGALGAVNVSADLWQHLENRAVGEPLPSTALSDGRHLSIVRVDRISG